jgi:hypothetical protein
MNVFSFDQFFITHDRPILENARGRCVTLYGEVLYPEKEKARKMSREIGAQFHFGNSVVHSGKKASE